MYSKKRPIGELKEGERVDDIFVVKIKKVMKPYVKGFMFNLILSDASGKSAEYSYWGEKDEAKVREIYDRVREDDVVLVAGYFNTFNNKPIISTNPPDVIRVLNKDEYNPAEFIKPPKRPLDEMVGELKGHINNVQNPQIKRVLERIFIEDAKFLDRFKKHPGAIEIHHNWTGGLLQHTLEMARYCEVSKDMFPGLDRDLLIAGVLLHDIGKIHEIDVTTRIKGTVKGQLKGHIPMGFNMLSNVMEELNTDEEIRNKLLHIVLSHHGSNEFGSPKEPMFSEAVAVYYADEMSSKLSSIIEFINEEKANTENDFMYHRRQKRNIYLK
ncbi:MAG: HD domain-containing protein [Candidatus Aenigmatarchaeota archaeon]